ncbi:MAG: M15 family metallopeptidase [Lachnospiraceae bacterium]|nr:M15 family metallopeptidase [Lachnospiraceae bacterium]
MEQNVQRIRQRQHRRKQKRKKKILRRLIFASALVVVFLFFAGMSKILVTKEVPEQEEAVASSSIVMEEAELVKPTEKPVSVDEDIPRGNPILVNKDNPLPKEYEVELITLADGRSKAAEEAYEPLCEMLEAAREDGMDLLICSSYRDRKRQEELFDEDVEALLRKGYTYTEAYEEVAKETMPPGCSEHSTGLAFDIVARDYQMLDKGQEKTAENKWLRKHCAEYGFILRYPKGKEDITKISYESWHFRYVGKELAEYIMEEEITLEEYLEKVSAIY